MAIADHCRQLQHLSILHVSTFTGASLNAITEKLDGLKCLSLEGLSARIDTHSLVEMISSRGKQLTALSLAGCHGVNRSLIPSLVSNCLRLTYLDLSSNKLGTLNVDLLQTGCPHLTNLYLDHLTLRSSSSLANESSGFRDLRFLTLACSTMLPCVQTVKRLLHQSSRLDTLDMRGWCDPVYNSLVNSLPRASNLRHLFVARWKNVDVVRFMAAISVYRQLIELDLNHCIGIDDAAATLFVGTPVLFSLKTLHLSGSTITATGLHRILAACPQLESLDLTSCRGVPRGLKRMHKRDSVQQMRNSTLG